MSDKQRRTTNTEPHLHSDMQLRETRETERDLQPKPGERMLLTAALLLRWWTWAFIVVAVLAPLAQWSWLGELSANCGKYVMLALLPGLAVFKRERISTFLICIALLAVAWPWARQAYEQRAPTIVEEGAPPFTVLVANMAYWNWQEPQVVADAILATKADVLVLVEAREAVVKLLRKGGQWRNWHRSRARDEYGPYSIAMATTFKRGGSGGDRVSKITGPVRDGSKREEIGFTSVDTVFLPVMHLTQESLPFIVLGMHSPPPTSPALWRHQVETYKTALERLEKIDVPVIVAGDWNATPASALWRASYDAGLRRVVGSEPSTWMTPPIGGGMRNLMGLPIDRVATRGFAMANVRAIEIPGSDHRGLLVDVQRLEQSQ